MATADAQKSEIHESTDDATSSPTFIDEAQGVGGKPHAPHGQVREPNLTLKDAKIVRDDTDVGGPLVIESADPELNPPHVPIDPFPTDAKPEIDPPIERP